MQIEEILKNLKSKDVQSSFSQEDGEILRNLVKEYPCNLSAVLLLLELAQLYNTFFQKSWVSYYKEIIATADKCWTTAEIAQVYRLGARLYSFDQDVDSQIEAATKALALYPHDWRNINAYLAYNKNLSGDTAIPLISRISDLAPEDALALYSQGRHFEIYANILGKEQYRDAAIKAYQRSLELGLSQEKYGVPNIAAENAIKRLQNPLNL